MNPDVMRLICKSIQIYKDFMNKAHAVCIFTRAKMEQMKLKSEEKDVL